MSGELDLRNYRGDPAIRDSLRPWWNALMTDARHTAIQRHERVRVVAVRSRLGYWAYVIDCPSWCACRESA